MFQELSRLVEELETVVATDPEFKKYKTAKEARKVLQHLIVEAKVMRKTINDERKNNETK